MNPEIFREYDIRGVVGKDFDNRFAYLLGAAFAVKPPFIVGFLNVCTIHLSDTPMVGVNLRAVGCKRQSFPVLACADGVSGLALAWP